MHSVQYFPEVIPLFEAYTYLTQRFAVDRTADRIRYYESRKDQISHKKWTYFERIAELQNELDELIAADGLLEHYFTPLKTKEHMPDRRPITLGGMLLYPPPGFEYPFSFEGLMKYCEGAEQQALLDCYYGATLAPFYTDNCEMDKVSMSFIISAVNSILVDTEDKWAIIDCISNPLEHLEKLRPIVTRVIDYIKEKSVEFSDIIAEEMGAFCAPNAVFGNLGSIMHAEIRPKDFASAKAFVSLLSFNGVELSYKLESLEYNRIVLGIFLNTIIELRSEENNADVHIKLLKMLSDRNRFKILHELCGRESYGQELADKFGGARSGIYYHLEKLLGYGLIDVRMTEYRTLYKMNRQNVYDNLTALRDYLVDGWKPENAE